MSKDQSIQELMAFNTRVNMGSYLDSCEEIAPGLLYLYSKNVPDANCNLGYRRDGAGLSPRQVELVEKVAVGKSRDPAIWQISGQPIPPGYQASSQEVWMATDTSARLPREVVQGAKVQVYSPVPTTEMVDVFDDVYCQGKGDVGYTSLPHGYVDLYRSAVPNAPARAFHIGVNMGNECVAISNVNILEKIAGLYSVAVRQEYRRKGLGRLVAAEGVRLAAKEGARKIMLRTMAGSLMQTMYESVGFKPVFVAELLKKA